MTADWSTLACCGGLAVPYTARLVTDPKGTCTVAEFQDLLAWHEPGCGTRVSSGQERKMLVTYTGGCRDCGAEEEFPDSDTAAGWFEDHRCEREETEMADNDVRYFLVEEQYLSARQTVNGYTREEAEHALAEAIGEQDFDDLVIIKGEVVKPTLVQLP